jgi:hypothetical protein
MRYAASSLIILSLLIAGCVYSTEKITPPGNFNPLEGKPVKSNKIPEKQSVDRD